MNDYDVQFLSSLSPKIDRKKKTKSKGPTVLSLKKHFRKSLLLDQSQRIASNNAISVIEISSSDSGCSNNLKELHSCSRIIIDESRNSEDDNNPHSDVSQISNLNSDNGEIIPPSPERKKISYECVSTSKIKEFNKLHCGDLPKTKLFEIMKWKKNVDEYNEDGLDEEKIQSYESIERSVVSYDEFENKRKIEGSQVLNSTMLPIPMKNNFCIEDFYDDTRSKENKISFKKLDNKVISSVTISSTEEGEDFNKSCEDLLDELYGTSWRLKRDEILSKSEKTTRKKKVLNRENFPNSERKSKESNSDSRKLNPNNLLKILQTKRIKRVIDFPNTEDCCVKQYNDNENLKTFPRDIIHCDLSKKVSAVQENKVSVKDVKDFESRDSKKYDEENSLDFSDKENAFSVTINSLDYKELDLSGSDDKLKETHKLKKKVKVDRNNTKDKNRKGMQKTNFSGITENGLDVLPDTKDIFCHIKNKDKNCMNDKVRKTKKNLTEIGSDNEKFTGKSVEQIEVIDKSEKSTYSFLASLSKNIPDSQCNISAKIFRNNYKQYKENLAKNLFNLYNKEIFNNALPNTTILEWNSRMSSTAGFCHSKKITHKSGDVERISKIVLSTKVLDSADRLRDTLIHEMCHAATWVVDQISNGHGECWTAWTKKASQVFPELPPIKRCHNYQINTKYTYRCTGCGYSIGRHRKSLDIERKRCGHCLGKFEVLINTINKKGQKKTVPSTPKREPTGFALFVKENYSHYKEPGVNHGSVMKLLSAKFNEMKV